MDATRTSENAIAHQPSLSFNGTSMHASLMAFLDIMRDLASHRNFRDPLWSLDVDAHPASTPGLAAGVGLKPARGQNIPVLPLSLDAAFDGHIDNMHPPGTNASTPCSAVETKWS